MHGRSVTFPAPLRAILLGALLALLALPAAAWAGVAEVRLDTVQTSKSDVADVWSLSYAGGDEANVVSVRVESFHPAGGGPLGERMMVLTDAAGVTPGSGCARLDPTDATTVVCGDSESSITAPSIQLGGGDDSFTFADGSEALTGITRVDGGPGNDVLHVGDFGGILRGGPGDELFGGAGGDWFDEGDSANGSDTIVGAGGNSFQDRLVHDDVVRYNDRRDGVVVDLAHPQLHDSGEPGEHDTISGVETVEGGHGDDRVIADDLGDTLHGGPGDDTIVGGRGGDTIDGERGADSLSGGDGVDNIDAGGGLAGDHIDGGGARDYIHGSRGDDTIAGGRGTGSSPAAASTASTRATGSST
jgi:Ca2+-binding RTX toxin-like protein